MVIEHAIFTITPGSEADFEAAIGLAQAQIAASNGFRGLILSRGIESPSTFLLLVEWDSIEDHVVGFRESERFIEWRRLISPYFSGAPEVAHYAPVSLPALP